jgi:hypothetical protein
LGLQMSKELERRVRDLEEASLRLHQSVAEALLGQKERLDEEAARRRALTVICVTVLRVLREADEAAFASAMIEVARIEEDLVRTNVHGATIDELRMIVEPFGFRSRRPGDG